MNARIHLWVLFALVLQMSTALQAAEVTAQRQQPGKPISEAHWTLLAKSTEPKCSMENYNAAGSSGTYYERNLALDLAITDAKSNAVANCSKGVYYTRLTWGGHNCMKHKSRSGQATCIVRLCYQCLEKACDKSTCGTEKAIKQQMGVAD